MHVESWMWPARPQWRMLAAMVVLMMGMCEPVTAADFEGSAEYYRGYRDALRDIARVGTWRSGAGRAPSGYRRSWPDRTDGAVNRDSMGGMTGRLERRADGASELDAAGRQSSVLSTGPAGRTAEPASRQSVPSQASGPAAPETSSAPSARAVGDNSR